MEKTMELTKATFDSFEWREYELNFKAASLPEIFSALRQRYRVDFQTEQLTATGERYSTRFADDKTLDDVLNIVQILAGNFTYRIEGDTVKINRN